MRLRSRLASIPAFLVAIGPLASAFAQVPEPLRPTPAPVPPGTPAPPIAPPTLQPGSPTNPPGARPPAPTKPEAEPGAEEMAPGEPKPAKPEGGGEEEELSEEDKKALEELDKQQEETSPQKPPAKGKGVIVGVVKSSSDGEALIEAQVSVVGEKRRVLTDLDGRYRLELPPGTYELRFVYELHKSRRMPSVVVAEGKVVTLNMTLDPDAKAEVEVTAIEVDAIRSSTANQYLLRRNSASATDAIGAQEIARTPDRNAADTAKRVVGASVIGNRYVYVRGLGERYTNSLLNGAPLPSPEPDRQAVPLDVFPSVLLSDLTIQKTFLPDMPGDFAGGSVIIHTRDFPEKFNAQVTLNGGVNSIASFNDRPMGRPGGGLDWLGMDDGTRALPSEIPSNRIEPIDRETKKRVDLGPYGRALNTPLTLRQLGAIPNFGISAVVGDSLRFGKDKAQNFGYQAAVSYSRQYTLRQGEIIRTFAPGNTPSEPLRKLNDYVGDTGTERTSWSTFGSASYGAGANHRFTLTGVYTNSGDWEGRVFRGENEERGYLVEDTRVRFVSRGLAFGQLHGEHKLPSLNKSTLNWTASLSNAGLNDPDLRNTVYAGEPGRLSLEENPLSGLHFFGKQNEVTGTGTLDYTLPILQGKNPLTMKGGAFATVRRREFTARRFIYHRNTNYPGDQNIYTQSPDDLFVDENIGSGQVGDTKPLYMDEQTQPNDAYRADYDVYSGFLMSDITLAQDWRVVLGGRLEASRQTINNFDQFANVTTSDKTLARTDFLPSLNLIYRVTGTQNVRLSASQTVARPQLRELAPFLFTDYFGGRDVQGNPNLDRTRIANLDARWEWFPGATEVVAASVFYKRFDKAIEPVILNTGGRGLLSFANAPTAENFGAEVELRKGLGFLAPSVGFLRDMTAMFNTTLVYSRVELKQTADSNFTSAERPLAGQSPFLVNAALDYSNDKSGTRLRLLYNIFGARIAQVGQAGLPDVYEQPRNTLDFTAAQRVGNHVDVKLALENILNAPYVFTHGTNGADAFTVNRFQLGTNATVYVTISN